MATQLSQMAYEKKIKEDELRKRGDEYKAKAEKLEAELKNRGLDVGGIVNAAAEAPFRVPQVIGNAAGNAYRGF